MVTVANVLPAGYPEKLVETVLGPCPDGEPEPLRRVGDGWFDLADQWLTMSNTLRAKALAGTGETIAGATRVQAQQADVMQRQGKYCMSMGQHAHDGANSIDLGQLTWIGMGAVMAAQLIADMYLLHVGAAKAAVDRAVAQAAWRGFLTRLLDRITAAGLTFTVTRSRMLITAAAMGGVAGAAVPAVAQYKMMRDGNLEKFDLQPVVVSGIGGAVGGLAGAWLALGAAPAVAKFVANRINSPTRAVITSTLLLGAAGGAGGGLGGGAAAIIATGAYTGEFDFDWHELYTAGLSGFVGGVIGGSTYAMHAGRPPRTLHAELLDRRAALAEQNLQLKVQVLRQATALRADPLTLLGSSPDRYRVLDKVLASTRPPETHAQGYPKVEKLTSTMIEHDRVRGELNRLDMRIAAVQERDALQIAHDEAKRHVAHEASPDAVQKLEEVAALHQAANDRVDTMRMAPDEDLAALLARAGEAPESCLVISGFEIRPAEGAPAVEVFSHPQESLRPDYTTNTHHMPAIPESTFTQVRLEHGDFADLHDDMGTTAGELSRVLRPGGELRVEIGADSVLAKPIAAQAAMLHLEDASFVSTEVVSRPGRDKPLEITAIKPAYANDHRYTPIADIFNDPGPGGRAEYQKMYGTLSHGIRATSDPDGTLHVTVITGPGTPPARQMFREMMDAVGYRTTAILAHWTRFNPVLGDNLDTFNANIQNNTHPIDSDAGTATTHTAATLTVAREAMALAAARDTYTGKIAAEYGLTDVQLVEQSGPLGEGFRVKYLFAKPT